MPIKAPYLPLDKLRVIAEHFLAEHNRDGQIPVPIDRIIEIDFNMFVVPIPGLLRSFEIDGWISNDLGSIYIDQFIFKRRVYRYRFSLAHELSHRLIHADSFRGLTFRNTAEWKSVIGTIPPDQYQWLERQAYWLAGLILVPPEALDRAYTKADESAAAAGISLADCDAHTLRSLFSDIGDGFAVSKDVIERRLREDRILK